MIPTSQAEAVVKKARARATIYRNDRQAKAAKALSYFEDYEAMVDDLTETYKTFHANQKKWEDRPKSCFSLLAAVVDTLCGLFREPPRYTWPEDDSGKKWAERFGLFKSEHITTMQDVESYGLVTGATGVRPMVTEDRGPLTYALYTGDQLDPVPEATDPGKMQQLTISFRSVDGSVIEHTWDDRVFFKTVDGTPHQDTWEAEHYPGGVHEYGIIPVILFHNTVPRWGLMGAPLTDLVAANLRINRLMTDSDWKMALSGSILYTVGYTHTEPPMVGIGSWIELREGGEAGFLEMDPQTGALIDAINTNLRLFLMTKRIPESAIQAVQSGESGIKVVADQSALADYRKRKANLFRPHETTLIRLALYEQARHTFGERGVKLKDIPAPSIQYTLPQEPMSMERREDWKRRQEVGLASPVDEIMALDPSLSRDQALQRIKDNLALTRELREMSVPGYTDEQGNL